MRDRLPTESDTPIQVTNPEQVGCLMRAPSRGASVVICAGLLQSWLIAWMWAFRPEDYEMFAAMSRVGDPFRFGAAPGAEEWIRTCHRAEGLVLVALVVMGAAAGMRLRVWPHLVGLLALAPLAAALGLGVYFYLLTGAVPVAEVWLRAWRALALAWLAGNLWATPWYRPRGTRERK